MSATNSTPNIELPVFVGTDKPAWLTDWNGAMNKIDAAVGSAETDISGLETAVATQGQSITSLTNTVGQHTTSIQALTTATTHNAGDINTINSLIGNGEPTTTDKTLIGAINELYDDIHEPSGGIEAENVSYDNTTSGLTATDVQAAIDELAAGSPTPGGSGYVFTHFNDSVSITTTGSNTYAQELKNLVDAFMNALSAETDSNIGYKITAAEIGNDNSINDEVTGRSEVVMKGENFVDLKLNGATGLSGGTVMGMIIEVVLSSTVANCDYNATVLRASANEHTNNSSSTIAAGVTWKIYFDKVKSL